MNRVQVTMKMHFKDKWTWFFNPWIILAISFLINLAIGYLSEEIIYSGGLSSIYIFFMISGILTLAKTFPYAIGMGLRRTDFFLGTAAAVTLVSAVSAVLIFLLSVIEKDMTGGWGADVHYFHLPYLNDGNVFEQLWIYFIVMVNMFFLGFAICSMFMRFGSKGMYIFFIGLSVFFMIGSFIATRNQWWEDISHWIGKQTAFELGLWMVPLTLVYALVSFLLIRRTTI